MVAQPPQYSPKQIAAALQASESSIKRWCDQGAIPTIRTVGGHRRITLEGLQSFLARSNRSLQSPQALGLRPSPPAGRPEIPGGQAVNQLKFRQALAVGDEAACRTILRDEIAARSMRSLAAEWLIADAMHGIGEAWECSVLDAYQERRGCDICLRLMNELRAELPPARPAAPVALGGTPSGDPYQLPTALVELTLREMGWNATNLGANLPIDSILQAVTDYRPKLVWLSVSALEDRDGFVVDQNRLAAELDEDVTLLVGGRALTDDLRPRLQYTAYCDNLRNLIDLSSMMQLGASGLR